MIKFNRGIFYIGISVLLYSIMPVLIRVLGKGHIPPVSQVFLRYCVACVAATVYFLSAKSPIVIQRKDIVLLFLVSFFGYALVNLFYTYANLNTQIGTVLFIFNCSTVMGPLLGFLFLKEQLTVPKIIAMCIGFIALFFLFSPGPFATWKTGAIFALLSALGSSFYVIGRKKLVNYDSRLILVSNTVIGVITIGILAVIFERNFYISEIKTVTSITWLTTILFGLDNFAAYLFMTKGFQLISAGTGIMVMLSENFIGILFAFLFFAEVPTVSTLLGGGLILAASLLVIFYPTRSND